MIAITCEIIAISHILAITYEIIATSLMIAIACDIIALNPISNAGVRGPVDGDVFLKRSPDKM